MRIGVLGGGQLGRMLALAGVPLGHDFVFVDPAPDACAGPVGELIVAPYDEVSALDRLADDCDIVTFEFERVPALALHRLVELIEVRPSPAALEAGRDRVREKQLFVELGVDVARFEAAGTLHALESSIARIGVPVVVKTRTQGYDGKGQVIVEDETHAEAAWNSLGGASLIVEELIDFRRELSIVAARSDGGQIRFYPVVENHHRDGILRKTLAPAPGLDTKVQSRAEDYARSLLERLDYVGVLAVELFEVDGRLLGNEFAPRVHNSGHWTIEGAVTSQFENHIRAITNMPLGSARARGYAAMINLIGTAPAPIEVLGLEGAHLHLYGKEPRLGRKLGHVTFVDDDEACLLSCVARFEALRS